MEWFEIKTNSGESHSVRAGNSAQAISSHINEMESAFNEIDINHPEYPSMISDTHGNKWWLSEGKFLIGTKKIV